MKLLQQGAEAKIFLNKNTITKSRIPKTYRHKQLDKKLRTRRTKAEIKNLIRAAQAKVNVPKILSQDKQPTGARQQARDNRQFDIHLEFLNGERLSQTLSQKPTKQQISIIKKLATQIRRLHNSNLIHADLTTSNTIFLNNKIYLIDFGLSYYSTKTEDKAADLHILNQALQAKHHKTSDKLFQAFLKSYNIPEVIQRLKIVESRGRYKN
jgi:TP53 regulating kinase-like protein